MTAALLQLALAVFGLAALAMAMGQRPALQKWAPIVGLLGQPFWFWFAMRSSAWGLLVLAVAFTATYAFGAWVQWKPAA